MSKKPSAGGKIQWTKMFRKLSPYPLHEALWTKGILDQAA